MECGKSLHYGFEALSGFADFGDSFAGDFPFAAAGSFGEVSLAMGVAGEGDAVGAGVAIGAGAAGAAGATGAASTTAMG